jgi:hypothetical protein
VRYLKDAKRIAELETAVVDFLAGVRHMILKLKEVK